MKDITGLGVAYISGKIAGKTVSATQEVIDKFEAYDQKFTNEGYTVINPIKLHNQDEKKEWHEYMRVDLAALVGLSVRVIFLLPDWRESRGATVEAFIATVVGIPVLDADSLEPIGEMDILRSLVDLRVDLSKYNVEWVRAN